MLSPMRNEGQGAGRKPAKMTAKIYAIMALTMVLTFASLETAHQLFFPPQQLFA